MFAFLRDLPLIAHELIHLLLTALAVFLVSIAVRLRRRRGEVGKATPGMGRLWLAALISGFFIDIDHFADYFFCFLSGSCLYEGVFSFFTVSPFLASGRVIVPLHAWEILILGLLVYLVRVRNKQFIIITFILSYGFHLLLDQLTWPTTPWGYFLIDRFFHGFSLSSF